MIVAARTGLVSTKVITALAVMIMGCPIRTDPMTPTIVMTKVAMRVRVNMTAMTVIKMTT